MFVIIAGFIVYVVITQFFIVIEQQDVEVYSVFDDMDSISIQDVMKYALNDEDTKDEIDLFNEDLFSEDKEFKSYTYNVNLKNISVFKLSDIQCTYENQSKYNNRIIYGEGKGVVSKSADRFGETQASYTIYVDIEGLTDSEISEMISKAKLELYYDMEFFGMKSKEIDISDWSFKE